MQCSAISMNSTNPEIQTTALSVENKIIILHFSLHFERNDIQYRKINARSLEFPVAVLNSKVTSRKYILYGSIES